MPAKSKAQQRLFSAAEHGAQFPLAQKLRQTMTTRQLHDFASGSEQGKPQHVKKQLHPALHQRAQAVKAAHAHLKATVPHFARLSGRDQIQHAQRHATRMLKRTRT